MKVKLNYAELTNVLGYVNTVLSDKTVDESMKNIIFLVKDNEATVVGYSPLTFSRTVLSSVETEGFEEGETWEFQVKSLGLNKTLGSFSSLTKTRVDEIEFSVDKNKIKVNIKEVAIEEKDSKMSKVSSFRLDSVPILDAISKEIHTPFPEEADAMLSGDITVYVDSLFPMMNNDQANGLSSKLNFDNDWVFVVSNTVNSFFKNTLPDAFKGITLGYSSISFLKKLCDGAESLDVHRLDNYLCIRSGNTEAFLKHMPVKAKSDPYVSRMMTDNGIVLNRLYFRDVLKRMIAITNKDSYVKILDEDLEVSNEAFHQLIPLENKKGNVDNINFKVSVPVLAKTIVGDDSVFPEEIFIYFVKAGAGYILFVKDKSGRWFSTVQVRV